MSRLILKACLLWAVLFVPSLQHDAHSADSEVAPRLLTAESAPATKTVESDPVTAEPAEPEEPAAESTDSESVAEPLLPAVELYPAETKGFVSVPDPDDFMGKFYETQLGQLATDPAMQPFVEDLKSQIQEKLNTSHIRLGVGWDELAAVCNGELSFAIIDPPQSKQNYAFAAIVDVNGQEEEVAQLLKKIERNMAQRGATRELQQQREIPITVYTVPVKKGGKRTFNAVLFSTRGRLVACDHLETAIDIVASLAGEAPSPRLAELPAYQKVMERCARDADQPSPQVRWFVDPLGYARVARAAAGGRRRRGIDILKVISEQGFDAIQAVGGLVNLATGTHEILHRTFVYAPAVERKASDDNVDKYDLAARILEFRNGEYLEPPAWVPGNAATYASVNWDAKRAFGYISTLVDAIADSPGFFEDLLGSLETDQHGPQLNVREELVAHLGDRVTLFTDCVVPVTPSSERVLLAVSLTNPVAMGEGVEKMFRTDPNARRLVVDGHTLWEMVKEDEEETPGLVVDGGDLGSIPGGLDEEDDSEEGGLLFPTIGVIGVVEGQLMISSHVELVAEIIQRREDAATLEGSADLDLVNQSLADLGIQASAIRFFTRTDEEYRATYELVRRGRMPESESILGRVINRLLGPDEKGVLREQQIDGKKMPEYQMVRRYLGPGGIAIGTEDAGWYAVGVLLNKSAPSTPDPLPEPLETASSDDGLLSE